MSIALCTLKNGTYNHAWRLVTALIASPLAGRGKALWQCDDCHRIVEGRGPNLEEAQKYSKGEPIHVLSVEIPA